MPSAGDRLEASGNITFKLPREPAVHGTVDCLPVEGIDANLSGQLDDGRFFRIGIRDTPSVGPDEATIDLTENPVECDVERVRQRILNGNFRVDDNCSDGPRKDLTLSACPNGPGEDSVYWA